MLTRMMPSAYGPVTTSGTSARAAQRREQRSRERRERARDDEDQAGGARRVDAGQRGAESVLRDRLDLQAPHRSLDEERQADHERDRDQRRDRLLPREHHRAER